MILLPQQGCSSPPAGSARQNDGSTPYRLTRIIRPEEGAMLLFPSHLSHRTIPFRADRARISIAFDAVPMP